MKKHYRYMVALAVVVIISLVVWAGFRAFSTPEIPEEPARVFTLAEVESSRTTMRCWTAIEADVYDLTEYVAENKGLLTLCGTDATASVKQLDVAVTETLAGLRIGSLDRE